MKLKFAFIIFAVEVLAQMMADCTVWYDIQQYLHKLPDLFGSQVFVIFAHIKSPLMVFSSFHVILCVISGPYQHLQGDHRGH